MTEEPPEASSESSESSEEVSRACLACDNLYVGPLACPKCGEPGEPLDVIEPPDPVLLLLTMLATVEAPREATGPEVPVIVRALLTGRLDNVVAEPPMGARWFVAPGGFAALDEGTLCRCWVEPGSRGQGVGSALYRVRRAAALESGVKGLTVTVRGVAQVRVYEGRGFRVTARLKDTSEGAPRFLMGRLL